MSSKPNRETIRKNEFYDLAKQGFFTAYPSLYMGEQKKLEKQGFSIMRFGEMANKPLPSKVSWENPFGILYPPIVYDYIYGITQTFPHSAIENMAQELFVIAARKRVSIKFRGR